LKDVENLDVNVFYSGKDETTSVYLQKGVSANIVTINSAQFSQEADLESEATFDLSLEKFSGEENVFRLRVVNLPQQISYEFLDPQTQARLSQIKFTEGVTSMQLSLRLYLPKNADEHIVIANTADTYSDQGYQVFEWESGNLSNSGETIILKDANGVVIDFVNYDDLLPWPLEPDGDEPSLALVDPSLPNSLPGNWKGSDSIGDGLPRVCERRG